MSEWHKKLVDEINDLKEQRRALNKTIEKLREFVRNVAPSWLPDVMREARRRILDEGAPYPVDDKVQAFYDSEQNAKIEWFWDAGFYVTLGDEMSGWGTMTNFQTFEEVAEYLYSKSQPTALSKPISIEFDD